MEEAIAAFANKVGTGDIEIYNKCRLQHEMGVYLRQCLPAKKVQFERNVSYFGMNKINFVKREIDIAIFDIQHGCSRKLFRFRPKTRILPMS